VKLKDDHRRLWDLVCYLRYGLHFAGLITDEEHAELTADAPSIGRSIRSAQQSARQGFTE